MKLYEAAKLIRAKNAGPFILTIDILFATQEMYDRVRVSDRINKEVISNLYNVPVEEVQEYFSPKALAIKYSFKRPHFAGALDDVDIYGGQYHAPLVMIDM